MRGEELFAKDCLGMKALKKMDKGELMSTIEINLQSLVDYYFEDYYRKDESEYRETLQDLVLSKKYFLKPLSKIMKENPDSVPSGTAYMIYEVLNNATRVINDRIQAEKDSNKPKEEKEKAIDELNMLFKETQADVFDCLAELTTKARKKLKKLDIKKEYCAAIAPVMLPTDYITNKNLGRMVRSLTSTLYNVYKASIVSEDEVQVSTLGLDITKPKNISKLFMIFTKNMDIGTFANFIKQILLEKRDKSFDNMDSNHLAVYNAISAYALGMLDDKEVFSSKTRQEVIRGFSEQRRRDEKRGFDARRRVTFSELDPDIYPRIAKAFDKVFDKKKDED